MRIGQRIYISTARPSLACLDELKDTNFIRVVVGQSGYETFKTLKHETVTEDTLNKCTLPECVIEAAIAGSMFGWAIPAARPVIDYNN